MSFEDDDLPDSQPEPLTPREELQRLRVWWNLCCASPLLYLLLAVWIDSRFFTDSDSPGGLLNPGRQARFMLGAALAGFAACGWAAQFFIRSRPLQRLGDPAAAMRVFRRRILTQLVLSDLIAFLGFFVFLLSGDMRAVLAGGVAGFVSYGLSYPGDQALVRLEKQ